MKHLTLVLIIALAACNSPVEPEPEPVTQRAYSHLMTILVGDATGDGVVNIIDAQQISRWSVGLSTGDFPHPIGTELRCYVP